MPFLPSIIITLLTTFKPCFTKPTWEYAQTLLIGAILCPAKRTVTACLQVMGLSKEKHFDRYHRVLNRAKWNEFQLVKILLGLIISILPSDTPIIIAMDETIERRKGPLIKKKGCYRDSCRSTKSLVIKCFGLKWQCASILVKFPWNNRPWALPFMTVLCVAKTYDDKKFGYKVVLMKSLTDILGNAIGYFNGQTYYEEKLGVNILVVEKLNLQLIKYLKSSDKAAKKVKLMQKNIHNLSKKNMTIFTSLCGQRKIKHRTSVEYAMLMMRKISMHLKRPWILLGDGGFACVKLGLACVRAKVTLVSRLRLDAALYEPIEDADTKKAGRKKLKGNKAESLNKLIQQKDLAWIEQEVTWYRGVKKRVNLFTGTNLWYTTGFIPLPIRWVIVKDLDSGRVEAFFSTDQNLDAATIVEYFVLRWNIEVTFEEVRAHLGVETQRQWSDKAINRTTPLLMGIFSFVCILAYKLTNGAQIPVMSTAWYDKNSQATFSDVIRYVKQAISRESYLNKSVIYDDFVQISRSDFENIVNIGLMAA